MPGNIHVNNSYNIWKVSSMNEIINQHTKDPKGDMNRTYLGMYIEWYLHNIGYYITLPLTFIPRVKKINYRFQHVDLEGHYDG